MSPLMISKSLLFRVIRTSHPAFLAEISCIASSKSSIPISKEVVIISAVREITSKPSIIVLTCSFASLLGRFLDRRNHKIGIVKAEIRP